MNEKIRFYKDEEDLESKYCQDNNCKECLGSDQSGEPNGYGCEAREEWLDQNRGRLIENRPEAEFCLSSDVALLESELEAVKKEITDLRESHRKELVKFRSEIRRLSFEGEAVKKELKEKELTINQMKNEIEARGRANTELKKERGELLEVLRDTRKFLDRLPCEWYPETIASLLDDALSKEKKRKGGVKDEVN